MPRQTIIWNQEEDDGPRFLDYRDEFDDGPEATPQETTLEDLADLCDQEAENCNAHDFVGVHRALAALLYQQVGRPVATRIMREVAELGGLDGMTGICGQDDTYEELGISESGDWKLPD